MVAVTGETVRLRLSWRQAMTPSVGLWSIVYLGAVLGLVMGLRDGHGRGAMAAGVAVAATVLWRRCRWLVQLGPEGLLVRRFRRRAYPTSALMAARVVGCASQLRVEVELEGRTLLLPAPRGEGLVAGPAFHVALEQLNRCWLEVAAGAAVRGSNAGGIATVGAARVGEPVLILRRRLVSLWPWMLPALASLVWQLVSPTMGGDLTVVALILLVLLQGRRPRPALRAGLWIAEEERFAPWCEVLTVGVESRHGARRVLVTGRDFRERLSAPVDSWWAPDPDFDRAYRELVVLWSEGRAPVGELSLDPVSLPRRL